MTILTTAEAAARLRLSLRRVQQLVRRGQLAAVKRGRDWTITADACDAWAARRPRRGRPRHADSVKSE